MPTQTSDSGFLASHGHFADNENTTNETCRVAIFLTFGFELLIGSLPLLGLFAGLLLYIGGLFTQVSRYQAEL